MKRILSILAILLLSLLTSCAQTSPTSAPPVSETVAATASTTAASAAAAATTALPSDPAAQAAFAAAMAKTNALPCADVAVDLTVSALGKVSAVSNTVKIMQNGGQVEFSAVTDTAGSGTEYYYRTGCLYNVTDKTVTAMSYDKAEAYACLIRIDQIQGAAFTADGSGVEGYIDTGALLDSLVGALDATLLQELQITADKATFTIDSSGYVSGYHFKFTAAMLGLSYSLSGTVTYNNIGKAFTLTPPAGIESYTAVTGAVIP